MRPRDWSSDVCSSDLSAPMGHVVIGGTTGRPRTQARAGPTETRGTVPRMAQTAARPSRGNLPAELTSFVGRRRELTAIRSTLADAHLLTLTGAGGVGKTRLALHAGRELS